MVVFWIFYTEPFGNHFSYTKYSWHRLFPGNKRLFKTRQNSEPFLIWIGMLIAPGFSLLLSNGMLATFYSVRQLFMLGCYYC
jgi:hypothetical protein